MKQLTIYCSHDLEEKVVTVLDGAGIEGYVRLGHATANRFQEAGAVPRALTWEVTLFLVPGAPDEGVETVLRELSGYANACEISPCLRIVVSPVESVH
jgi:hypothetical protein